MPIDIGLHENLWEKKMMRHPVYSEVNPMVRRNVHTK